MKKKTVYLKKWITTVTIMFLAALALPVQAQNVTIRPQNGSMLCALTEGSPNTQLGFQMGAFGTWRHKQLSLTMTASNSTTTRDGQLTEHANHFISGDQCTFSPADPKRVPENYICAAWGANGNSDNPGYITIALPKGYRFTGYTFHITQDINTFGENSGNSTTFNISHNRTVTITENNPDFSGNLNRASMPANSTNVVEFKRTGDDMGNILYFTTSAGAGGYYAVAFRYIELTFTADADDPIDLLPGTQVTTGTSMLEIPFNTGKVDLGEISPGTYNGATRVSYQYNTVSDMSANMLLYEKESVQDNQTGFDGTVGKVAVKRAGSITTTSNYFKFSPDEEDRNDDGAVDDDDMQIYYLETPVSAKLTETIENPVQFRITGATIHYTKQTGETSFHITYTTGGTKYYLGTNGRFAESPQTVWQQDGSGHIHNNNNYLTKENSGYAATIRSATDAPVFTIDETTGTVYDASGAPLKVFTNLLGVRQGVFTNETTISPSIFEYNLYPAVYEEIPGTAPVDNYTIYVYDKEGKNPKAITVTRTGSEPIDDLNNDAIMFGVKGGDVALLNFTFEVQALNPYINQMSVVMNDTDDGKNLRMTQTFTSDDFSVGGDKFVFYLPVGCKGDKISMTFEDLYSKYGDNTYDHTDKITNNNSRYNFVQSQHYLAFTNDNIYNAKAEAASATLESARLAANNGLGQNVRTKVGIVGDTPFRFNNADVLSSTEGYLTEYPFTLANYANQTNGASGSFITAEFENVGDNGTATDNETFYVFTTDETRYNIAPTTATQHRAYAFYEMEVELICRDYTTGVEFVPIYKDAFYQDENGKDTTGDFFGVKVTAPADVTTPLASDLYVHKSIAEKIKENKPATITGTEAINAYVAAEMKKILYLDMSRMKGVYHSTAMVEEDEPYELADFNVLKAKFAPNALVFLPINTTSTFDNFAYAMKGEVEGAFKSANNFILTDKNPFYSPYTIQVDAANYARYTRRLTKSSYDGELWATVIMPFTIQLSGGQHTDSYGTLEFLQMNTTQATSNNDDYGTAFFSKTTASQVAANTPYALHVISNSSDGEFTINQAGSNIVATPDAAKNADGGNTLFSATVLTSTGNLKDKDNVSHQYTFSHKGSFSGQKVPKDDPVTFYFANNGFYSSADLSSRYSTVDLFPFRSVYEVTGGSAKVGFLHIMEGVNENETDGINAVRTEMNVDENAPVYDMQGRMIAPRMSDLKNKNLDRGIYVVNGVKFIVK